MTVALLSLVKPKPKWKGFALLEVCCDEKSMLRAVCLEKGIPYRGITAGVEMKSILDEAKRWVQGLRVNLHVHMSTLCSSGSPLRRFALDAPTELDAAWDSHIKGATSFMPLGQSTSFELPLNDIWKRWFVKRTLEKFSHNWTAVVHLCQTGLQGTDDNFIGEEIEVLYKTYLSLPVTSMTSLAHASVLRGHANFNYVTWRRTAFYNRCLAEEFISGLEKSYGKDAA